jgi:hypothetical protein
MRSRVLRVKGPGSAVKLTKRADPDGTFSVLDGSGNPVAIGLAEGDADARVASAAGQTGPGGGQAGGRTGDPAGIKAGGRAGDGKPRQAKGEK